MESVEEISPEQDLGKEKMATAFAKLLGFVAAIGLPSNVMKIKIKEYSQLAEETGVADALIDVIEYYFPDVEASPVIVFGITGIAFASAVMADRAEIKEKLKKKQETDRTSASTELVQKPEKLKSQSADITKKEVKD